MKYSSQRSAMKSNNENQSIIEEIVRKHNGELSIRKYMKGRFLGKGGFAKCFEMTCLDTKKVTAVKIIAKASLAKGHAKQKLMSEIKIHKSLYNPHVVEFMNYFEDNENCYIVLELCENQTLHDLIRRRRRLTELEAQCYLIQLIEGLIYIHEHKVIHRDLKLGNLFLTEKMELKIADFGLATKVEFEGEKKRTICGTPNYIAPEIIGGKKGHSYEVDIWSLGVILYTLLIGKPPFETQDVKTTYKKIKMNAYSFPSDCIISEHAKNLIQRILASDPSKRPTLKEIKNHQFFSQNQIPNLMPPSTLACPPSSSFLRQYNKENLENSPLIPLKMASTVAINMNKDIPLCTEREFKKADYYPLASARPQTEAGTKKDNIKSISSPSKTSEIQKHKSSKAVVVVEPIVIEKIPEVPEIGGSGTPIKGPTVWVNKFIDFSQKWGLGYNLSNGSFGVFFNDSTKIILDETGTKFDYIERQSADRQDIIASYTVKEYPQELQKKVTLLYHFKNYLEADKAASKDSLQIKSEEGLIYVKKWMKTQHANMFRLSNKIVQVKFKDDTEILLSSESKIVTYVNKTKERKSYKLSTALESSNKEMTSRLKYTKDILTRMINPQNNNNMNIKKATPALP